MAAGAPPASWAPYWNGIAYALPDSNGAWTWYDANSGGTVTRLPTTAEAAAYPGTAGGGNAAMPQPTAVAATQPSPKPPASAGVLSSADGAAYVKGAAAVGSVVTKAVSTSAPAIAAAARDFIKTPEGKTIALLGAGVALVPFAGRVLGKRR